MFSRKNTGMFFSHKVESYELQVEETDTIAARA